MSRDEDVIAVGLSDVITAFKQAWVVHHNQQYQTPFMTFAKAPGFDMPELYGVDEQTLIKRVRNFCHNHHDDIRPWRGVQLGLSRLHYKHDLQIVTSRCESLRDITADWLKDHGISDLFSKLHFTNGFGSLYPERKRSKLEVCLEIGAKALIEGLPENAEPVADAGIPVLMPYRPWNADFKHSNVHRFHNMDDIPIGLI